MNCEIFKDKITPILHKFFHKIEGEGILFDSFCKDQLSLIPIPDEGLTRKKKKRDEPICFMNIDAKILNKIFSIC